MAERQLIRSYTRSLLRTMVALRNELPIGIDDCRVAGVSGKEKGAHGQIDVRVRKQVRRQAYTGDHS